MSDWTTVTRAEFDAFIAAYPRPLDRTLDTICEPPRVAYYDLTIPGPDGCQAFRYFDDFTKQHACRVRARGKK